jgi:hypothetical protein
MGDILIHQCDRVNLNRFWDVMQFDIPELLASSKREQGMGNREHGLRMALGFRPPPTPTTFLWGTQTHYFYYAAGNREQGGTTCSLFPVPRCLLVEPSEQKNYTNILLKRIILEINAFSD